MGVYIAGMEMPTSCFDCNFCVEAYEGAGVYSCVVSDKCVCRGAGRHDDCPLVPVPPHGRLIDADALRAKQQEDADLFQGPTAYCDKCRRDEALNAVANIVNAPTVIEAEEGET